MRIRPGRLLATLCGTLVLLTALVLTSRHFLSPLLTSTSDPYARFTLPTELLEAVEASVLTEEQKAALPPRPPGSVFEAIQQSGVVRVGFNDSAFPFCYRNADGDLVGYDVAFAYRLAESLNARLELVPFVWSGLQQELESGKFDVAMSGIYATEQRLGEFLLSEPYHQSSLAFFAPVATAHDFRSRKAIEGNPKLRVGVFNDPVLVPWLKEFVPSTELVLVRNYLPLPDFRIIDGAFWSLVQCEAMAASHPGILAVAPTDLGAPVLFTYVMRKDASELRRYLNYWLELQQIDGFQKEQKAYWLERKSRPNTAPRWSIARNVLHLDW